MYCKVSTEFKQIVCYSIACLWFSHITSDSPDECNVICSIVTMCSHDENGYITLTILLL